MQNGAFRSAAENSEIKKTNHGACQSLLSRPWPPEGVRVWVAPVGLVSCEYDVRLSTVYAWTPRRI